MTASNYRPLGQLIGNSPDAQIRSDAPANASSFGYPTVQPSGAAALAAGEGASALSWNRFVAAAAMNTDRLFAGGHARPIAIPALLTSSEAADLGSVAAAALDLTPSGSFDGWVYHGTSSGDVGKYFRLLDSDGTPARTSAGALVEVTDVQYLDTSAAIGVEKTLHTTTLVGPATTADVRHKLKLTAAPSTSSMVAAATPMFGCIARVLSNTVNDATKGTNNGHYRIADGLGAGTEFKLVEYRHRIRLRSIVGTISAAETITGGSSGASFVVGAGANDVYSDYVEFDAITLGSGGRVFEVGETVSNGSGATGIVIAYTAPGDSVILNNDVNAPGSVIIKSDGSFSRLVQLILSGIPANASSKLLACGGKGAALEMNQGALAMAFASAKSGGSAGVDGLDGVYQRSSAPSASGLAGNPNAAIVAVTITSGGPFTVSEVLYETTSGRRFATVLQVDSSSRLVVAAHNDLPSSFPTGITGASSGTTANLTSVTLVRGRDVVVDAGAPINITGSQLLDLRAVKSALRVLMTADSLRNAGITVQGGSSTPASGNAAAIEVREPLTSVTYSVDAEEPVSYAWSGSFYTLTFSGTDLTNFFSTALADWDSAHTAIEIAGATHPALNGVYLPEVPTATTVRLRLLDNSGYATEGTATAGGHATARFFGRRVSAFGLNLDGGSILDLFMTAGTYKGLTLRRKGSTANTTLMQVQDSSIDLLLVKADVAAGTSDDPDYTEAPVLHTDYIRSSSDKRSATADGTRLIDLTAPSVFTFEAPSSAPTQPVTIDLQGNTDGALLLLNEQHALWSDPNGGSPLLVFTTLVGGVDRSMMTAFYVENGTTRLTLHSPTFSAGVEDDIASGDSVQLVMGNTEAILEAVRGDVGGAPDVMLRIANTSVVFTGYADGGNQDTPTNFDKKPVLAVPDITYGVRNGYYSDATYAGKKTVHMVPLTAGMESSTTRYWFLALGGALPAASLRMQGEAAPASRVIVYSLPPMGQGAAAEASDRFLQSVEFKSEVEDAADIVTGTLYMSDQATDHAAIVVSDSLTNSTVGSITALKLRPKMTGTAQGSTGADKITLSANASAIDDAYNNWTITITNNTPAGVQNQVVQITGYVGATRVATVTPNWGTAPDNTTTYVMCLRSGVSYEEADTSTAAAATTITLAAGASSENDWYNGQAITIVSGPGDGETKTIVDYNGGTRVATVHSAWSTDPTASGYVIGDIEIPGAFRRQFFLRLAGYTGSTNVSDTLNVYSIQAQVRNIALVPGD